MLEFFYEATHHGRSRTLRKCRVPTHLADYYCSNIIITFCYSEILHLQSSLTIFYLFQRWTQASSWSANSFCHSWSSCSVLDFSIRCTLHELLLWKKTFLSPLSVFCSCGSVYFNTIQYLHNKLRLRCIIFLFLEQLSCSVSAHLLIICHRCSEALLKYTVRDAYVYK